MGPGYNECVYLYMQDGEQAIHIATKRGYIEIVDYLLDEEGVSPRIHVKVHWLQ